MTEPVRIFAKLALTHSCSVFICATNLSRFPKNSDQPYGAARIISGDNVRGYEPRYIPGWDGREQAPM